MDSAELIDMIANNAPSSEVSDALKSMMYAKSADFVDAAAPEVAKTLFGEPEVEEDSIEAQTDAEVEQEPEQEEE